MRADLRRHPRRDLSVSRYDETHAEATVACLAHGAVRIRLFGRSMTPWVRAGARLAFEPIDPRDCRPGDVVMVRHGERLVTHRWVGGRPGAWLLRGDASPTCDAPVRDEQVLARARGLPLLFGSLPVPAPAAAALGRAMGASAPSVGRLEARLRATGKALWRHLHRFGPMVAARRRLARVDIERFEAKHLDALRAFLLRRGRTAEMPRWEQLLGHPTDAAFVACAAGRIVGHTSVTADPTAPGRALCGFLWIDPWYRSLGLAGELLERGVEHAAQAQFGETVTRVRVGSDSLRANRRLGFEPAPHLAARPGHVALLRRLSRSAPSSGNG